MVSESGDGYELNEVAVDAYTKAESDARYAPIAAAIRPTVTGETISVNDSVEWPLQGLTLYGKSTQDGTPTPDNPIPIVSAGDGGNVEVLVTGKNLLDISKMPQQSTNGITFSLENGGIKTSGTATANTDGPIFAFRLPVGTYISNMNRTRFPWLDSANYVVERGDSGTIWLDATSVFKVLDGDVGKYFYFRVKVGVQVNEIIYPQIEVGSTSTPYEPYQSQSLTATTPNGLPGIPATSGGNYIDADGQQWVCDEVDFGMGTHTQLIGKINSYNSEAVGNIWMSTTGQLTPGATVLYKLDNPIVSNLDTDMIADYKALTTYAPVTNIMTDSTPSAGLSVRYVADAQKYIDGKLSTINTQLLEVKTNV